MNGAGLGEETVKWLSISLLSPPECLQLFPILSKLYVRGLLLLLASVDCKHNLSAMNRIKTTPHNSIYIGRVS